MTRREWLGAAALAPALAAAQEQPRRTRIVRFQKDGKTLYGELEGDTIREISGDIFGAFRRGGTSHALRSVKLLYPCEPSKVLAVGLNYKSHIGNRTPPSRPEFFWKPITALQNPGDPIVIPADAKNVHFEGEFVLIIGKRTKNVSEEEAVRSIYGVTCGNDVSERDWQNGNDKDLQWWRAKGADTFAPMGPMIVQGLDYSKLLLRTRVNGEVKQQQYTSDLLFGPAAIVSFASKYVTLMPGDAIYTGTPGATSALKAGDKVEVEIEGIGTLENPVVAARPSS